MREIIPISIGWSSGILNVPIKLCTRAPPKTRMSESSIDTKNWVSPLSPCRPERPRSWLSIRLASCRSVPSTNSPPSSFTSCDCSLVASGPPSLISTPRPAMFVASVTAPFLPAAATISPSRSWFLALSISWVTEAFSKAADKRSFDSIDAVPIKIGWPEACTSFTFSIIALNFPLSFW